MRFKILLAATVLALSASAAAAAPYGCRRHNLGSNSYSAGANAVAPSRAIMNPCSSMYRFGRNSRLRFKRRHPGARVYH